MRLPLLFMVSLLSGGAVACEKSLPDPPPIDGSVPWAAIEEVKAQLLAGAALTIVDARPTADYEKEHIPGALSIPFYDGASRWHELLPTDRPILTYCGCPHAESGYLAQVLIANGFTTVHGLDEGFWEWKARGYPTVSGAEAGVMPATWPADAGAD